MPELLSESVEWKIDMDFKACQELHRYVQGKKSY